VVVIAQDEVYSIQHYVIKCVNDLRQVDGFLRVLRFPPPIIPTAAITITQQLDTTHVDTKTCNIK